MPELLLFLLLCFIGIATCNGTETCIELRNLLIKQNKTNIDQANRIESMEAEMAVLTNQASEMRADLDLLKKGISMKERRQTDSYAFTAVLNQDLIVHSGNILKFDKVLYNIGSLYNPITGIATIPVSGTYLFTVTIEHSISNALSCHLMVDGTKQVDVYIYPDGRGVQASNTAILGLQQGQSVWVETGEGRVYGSSTYIVTTFAGVFLYP